MHKIALSITSVCFYQVNLENIWHLAKNHYFKSRDVLGVALKAEIAGP
jgi:hypothetical protein